MPRCARWAAPSIGRRPISTSSATASRCSCAAPCRRIVATRPPLPPAWRRCAASTPRCWAARTRPYPGVAELLDGLTARGITMAVLSNKPHEFTQLCVAQLLSSWRFAAVLGDEPARAKKPDPAGAHQIAAQLGLSPQQFLYLGDTATDMQTARAAGMFAAGALWGFRTADELRASGAQALLTKPEELLGILDAAVRPHSD